MSGDQLASNLVVRLRDIAHGMNSATNQATLREAADALEGHAVPPNAVRYWDYLDKYAVEHVTEASDFLVKLMCDYADQGTQLSEARASMIGTAVDFMSQWTMMQHTAVTKSAECGACDKPGEHCANVHGVCSRHGGRPKNVNYHVCGDPMAHCDVDCMSKATSGTSGVLRKAPCCHCDAQHATTECPDLKRMLDAGDTQ
jgi:hypothetical protein